MLFYNTPVRGNTPKNKGRKMYCVKCGKETRSRDQYCADCMNPKNTGRRKKFIWLTLLVLTGAFVIVAAFTLGYQTKHSPRNTAGSFIMAMQNKDYAGAMIYLEKVDYLSLDALTAYGKLLEKNPERMTKLQTSLLSGPMVIEKKDILNLSMSNMPFEAVLVKHGFWLWNQYSIHVIPVSVEVNSVEGSKLVLTGIERSFESANNTNLILGPILPGIYEYSLMINRKFGELTGTGTISVLASSQKLDLSKTRMRGTGEMMKSLLERIDAFNFDHTGMVLLYKDSNQVLQHCVPFSKMYFKVLDDRRTAERMGARKGFIKYQGLLMLPYFSEITHDGVSIVTRETYLYTGGLRTRTWEYKLVYDTGRWQIKENIEYYYDFSSERNPLRIEH